MKVNLHPLLLLAIGMALMVASHLTVNIELFAWVAYVPFLLYLDRTQGWKSRLVFTLSYLITWSLIVAKIITAPLSVAMIPLFSIPIALIHLPAFLIWAKFRHAKGSMLLFPALLAVLEWVQYSFTPFASWGVAAYTQMDQLVLMQSVSLFGLAGLSFLIYWVNASIAHFIMAEKQALRSLGFPVLVLVGAICFGALRHDLGKLGSHSMVKVAAVGTDSQVGNGPIPSDEIRKENARALFARTRKAARDGAKLIVWNEAAAAIFPKEESAWKDSLARLTSEQQVALVAAYVVPISLNPLQYENKYLFFLEDGSLATTYFKHEPVPGEPAIRGKESFTVHEIEGMKVSGAICYDYDFPYIARGLGDAEAKLVALPSSDWRGIDPIHTQMAAFRAVEQGHSVLRSTRFGLSAAISPYGEMLTQMSSFDANDKIMLASLPRDGTFSLYHHIGDLFIYLCIAFIFWFLVAKVRLAKPVFGKGIHDFQGVERS